MLANSPAEVIRGFLVLSEAGNNHDAAEWPVFVGHLPEDPDNAICVYDTTGINDGRIMADGEVVAKYGWQVRVRGTAHDIAWGRITAIADALDGAARAAVAVGSNNYTLHSTTRGGSAVSLGQEAEGKRRCGFTLNGTATITEEN